MTGPSRLVSRALIGAIRTYQAVRAGRLSPCRFVPSCSEYSAQAIEEFGAVRGIALGVRRISRCRPFG